MDLLDRPLVIIFMTTIELTYDHDSDNGERHTNSNIIETQRVENLCSLGTYNAIGW